MNKKDIKQLKKAADSIDAAFLTIEYIGSTASDSRVIKEFEAIFSQKARLQASIRNVLQTIERNGG